MQFRSLACVIIKSTYSYFHKKGDFCQPCSIHHTKILKGDEKQLCVIRDKAVIAQSVKAWLVSYSQSDFKLPEGTACCKSVFVGNIFSKIE